jgi:N-acetylmuramoyl-L-alanine amidase
VVDAQRALAAMLLAIAVLLLPTVPSARSQPAPLFDADVGLDPGHSYVDVGASGGGLREFELTLDVALRTKPLLEAAGYSVRLSRQDHQSLSAMTNPAATEQIRVEQEARIASVGRVRCYVALHFNGSELRSLAGTETYYNVENNGGDRARQLAVAVHGNTLAALGEVGYASPDRGVKSDLLAGKPYGHFFGLRGPFPSIYVEALFLSNPTEAALLAREDVRQALAAGYARGIAAYLAEAPIGGDTVRVSESALARSEGGPNSR